jgi:dTDP-4-dehydrorhamnose 3,5-epimerase
MAEITALGLDGAWLYQSDVHGDSRGYFTEWFKSELVRNVIGREFKIAQANVSNSKRGVVRGIHFSIAKEGQAKWVTCISGKIIDFVVDIRPNSRTFKKWVSTELYDGSGRSIFISEGLGHAFIAMEDASRISYLLSSPYSPKEELAINPKDPEIAIKWPLEELHFSSKDESAPLLIDLLDTLKQSPHTGGN